ncbi:MAG: MerR family transcriptional regulator [Burkholderiaceae bacterium]|nr:MerR family transcriptional regulator [Burkholderiaceae bacterium]
MEKALPVIPAKRYFTIGEVSDLCGVKPYVLRYWEQEFTQLRPVKRRGNRRYYQHHEVLLIRRIRELLYEQGFTISGARNRLSEVTPGRRHDDFVLPQQAAAAADGATASPPDGEPAPRRRAGEPALQHPADAALSPEAMRLELIAIRDLLTVA